LRSREDAFELLNKGSTDESTILKFISTKYAHWRYEQEVRAFSELEVPDPSTGLYFAGFSDNLRLTEIIVGAESPVSRLDLEAALSPLDSNVTFRKARLAFKSFRVTTQLDGRF
jgi:hypothetical protein